MTHIRQDDLQQTASIVLEQVLMATRVDLERVFSEFYYFRFSVDKAIGSVGDVCVREQLQRMARSLDDDFADLQADAPAAWSRQPRWENSSQTAPTPSAYPSHLTRREARAERFGEQHEADFQRGIPPIHEVREDWNPER